MEIQKYFIEFAIKEAARFVEIEMTQSHKLNVNSDHDSKS